MVTLPLSTAPSGRQILTFPSAFTKADQDATPNPFQNLSFVVTVSDDQIILTPDQEDEHASEKSESENSSEVFFDFGPHEGRSAPPTVVELTYDD